MQSQLLPATTFAPQRLPLDRRFSRNTIIDDEPQETQRYLSAHSVNQFSTLSTIIDDSPTREDIGLFTTEQQHSVAFDDLYDMTDDEVDEIPIRISASIASPADESTPTSKRFPSLIIPSPSAWPTIQKLQKSGVDAPLLSPGMLSPAIVSPSPLSLSQLAARTMGSASSREPSLDGSLTSEELSSLSCPSTPDIERRGHSKEWSSPIQLHPQALQTLDSITASSKEDEEPILFVAEMREVDEQRPQLGLDVCVAPAETEPAELSALSVPSPGGFFSTLEPATRHAWLPTPTEQPSTTTAERFYNVPWAQSETLEQVVEIDLEDSHTEGPPTARRVSLASPGPIITTQNIDQAEWNPAEYKEHYQEELRAVSSEHFDRTTMWLQSQQPYLRDHQETSTVTEPMSAPLPVLNRTSVASIDEVVPPTLSKSVRFNDESPTETQEAKLEPVEKESTFVRSFEHLATKKNTSDVFVHRKTRSEKLRLDRQCLFNSHVNRLDAKYTLEKPKKSGPSRPVSDFFTGETEDEDHAIATALQQRRALEQVKPVSWNLEATKMLNGGTLLTSPTGKLMPKIENGRVLDLGGQATCDWAWQVALEHPSSTVHTVYTADQQVDSSIEGPTNHKQTKVPNLWTIPFPNDHFHLISARNLMSLLKTDKPAGKPRDEYDLCLRECMRVLKPGGYLEFAILDADIVGGGRQASALSVEFGFNLKTRGYDANPTKVWLPRLRRAGFAQVRRAWLSLPLAQSSDREGTTADASHISGLVGSWAWERWMLKLHKEMGREADRLLEGVPAALEDGAKAGASWRYLSGWARKSM